MGTLYNYAGYPVTANGILYGDGVSVNTVAGANDLYYYDDNTAAGKIVMDDVRNTYLVFKNTDIKGNYYVSNSDTADYSDAYIIKKGSSMGVTYKDFPAQSYICFVFANKSHPITNQYAPKTNWLIYIVIFVGIILIAIGVTYYIRHDNNS